MSITVIHYYTTIYKLFYFTFLLSCITGVPVPPENFYKTFIKTLQSKNCKMPEEIILPFSSSSDPEPFGYLSSPLKECQTNEALKEDDEAHWLCKEVFEVLTNITCAEYKSPLPKIKSSGLFDNICKHIYDMKDIFPKGEYMAPKLTLDGVLCNFLCSQKFKSLCQTLVWSYEVQSQIKNALVNEVQDGEENTKDISLNDGALGIKGKEDEKKDGKKSKDDKEVIAAEKVNVNPPKKVTKLQETNNENDLEQALPEETEDKMNKGPSTLDKLNLKVVAESSSANSLILTSSTVLYKTTDNQNSDKPSDNVEIKIEKFKKLVETDAEKQTAIKVNEIAVVYENTSDPKSKFKSKDVDLTTTIKDIIQPNPKLTDHLVETTHDQNKETSGSISIEKDKTTKTNNNNVQEYISSTSSTSTPDIEMNNNDKQEQVDESKGKELKTTLKNPDEVDISNTGKILENPKEADPGIPSIISSEIDSKLELTSQIPFEENVEEQHDGEDPDAYYETTLSQSLKNTGVKSSVTGEIEVGIPSSNEELFMETKNHAHGEIPMVHPFPEQEDTHFFFYFLSIVLILMAGYLIFHNKQKIIALIVEGRHERSRRRSHGAGYKKLETK